MVTGPVGREEGVVIKQEPVIFQNVSTGIFVPTGVDSGSSSPSLGDTSRHTPVSGSLSSRPAPTSNPDVLRHTVVFEDPVNSVPQGPG